jgi:hypothetical protein
MIGAVSTMQFGAILLASTQFLSAKDETIFAKCLWEKAPAEAEAIVSATDVASAADAAAFDVALMKALAKGGAVCGHAEGQVVLDRFVKAVHDTRPKDLSRPKDSSNGRTK